MRLYILQYYRWKGFDTGLVVLSIRCRRILEPLLDGVSYTASSSTILLLAAKLSVSLSDSLSWIRNFFGGCWAGSFAAWLSKMRSRMLMCRVKSV